MNTKDPNTQPLRIQNPILSDTVCNLEKPKIEFSSTEYHPPTPSWISNEPIRRRYQLDREWNESRIFKIMRSVQSADCCHNPKFYWPQPLDPEGANHSASFLETNWCLFGQIWILFRETFSLYLRRIIWQFIRRYGRANKAKKIFLSPTVG